MNGTPYELKLRKQKERKVNLFKNIQTKDLRKRSISYNIGQCPTQPNPQNIIKTQQKTQINHINVSNSIKKSFYYRKLFNKTIEHHLTYDYYRKVQNKFGKFDKNQVDGHHKNPSYSKIWEKQYKKIGENDEKMDNKTLQIISQNIEKNQSKDSKQQKKDDNKKKIEDIMQIAEQRKNLLTFQLEILGNRKSIRIKQCNNKNMPTESNNHNHNHAKSSQLSINSLQINTTSGKTHHSHHKTTSGAAEIKYIQRQDERKDTKQVNQIVQQNDSKNRHNIFLKTISERNNALLKRQEITNNLLIVTKLKEENSIPDFLLNLNEKRIKSIKNRIQEAQRGYYEIEDERQIKTKEQKRYSLGKYHDRDNKPETAFNSRCKKMQFLKNTGGNMNDIKGWFVGQEAEDQLQPFYQP